MIFVGDIALPYKGSVDFKSLPFEFYSKEWFGNLEGALVTEANSKMFAVFNQYDAIRDLLQTFQFKGFALANNHIFDTGLYETTKLGLSRLAIPHTGIGEDLTSASRPLILKEGSTEIIIPNFGWEVIQCEVTLGSQIGVNPLRRKHVLRTVKELVGKFPKAKVIPFMHWSYELESEPQPFERRLARELIDIGASGVIGCHPHRIGGVEIYKDKPIVYSLGNWLFRQNFYHNGKLKFPAFCKKQLAFEWDFQMESLSFHFFEYDQNEHKISFIESISDINAISEVYTPFRNCSDISYKEWYRLNHYHKNKGLPIYYWEDSDFKIWIKNRINRFRDVLLYVYLKIRKII